MTVTETYNEDFTSVDDDYLFDENRGYAPGEGGGGIFWSIKRPDQRKVYFTTPGPWTKEVDHGWWTWREIWAEEGLTGVGQLPFGLKSFPVRDQVFYTDDDGNRRRRDIRPDEEGYDHLLSLVVPYTNKFAKGRRAGSPSRPVRDTVGVSVVEVSPDGQLFPKVLTMSATRYRKISEMIKSFKAMSKDFSLVGFPWLISVSGNSSTDEVVSLTPLPDEPPIDLPEPIDIPEQLRILRQAVMEVVQSKAGVDVSGYADTAAQEPSSPTMADAEPGSGPVIADEPAAASKADLYATMTDTRLRTLLTKKGVAVAPKTPREELLRLAEANNV